MEHDSGFIVVHEKRRAPSAPAAHDKHRAATLISVAPQRGRHSITHSIAPTDFLDSVNGDSPTESLSSSYSGADYRSRCDCGMHAAYMDHCAVN
jgi:hypothetical protein